MKKIIKGDEILRHLFGQFKSVSVTKATLDRLPFGIVPKTSEKELLREKLRFADELTM